MIELRNLGKQYGTGEVAIHALSNINLKIKRKEFLSIIGPSGSGKSTLLHMIGLLDRPTSGKIFFDRKDTSDMGDSELAKLRGSTIGFIFQFFNLYSTLNALQNVELPMLINSISKPEREKRARELLDKVGLSQRANHLPSELSGGEIQRVAIARSLANNPQIILADEPTGNLDTKTGNEIINILKKLNKDFGVTIIMISHEASIAKITQRVIYLKDGKIVREKK